jgi:hypothetical protein
MGSRGILIKGMYRDILKGPGGAVILDTGWRSNTIVHGSRIMIAAMMKNDSPMGIQRLSFGQGEKAWDATPPGAAPEETDKLVSPYSDSIPVSEMIVTYLEADTPVSDKLTNCLQITATFKPGFPEPLSPLWSYPLREFGLFGSCGGVDYMINCVRHQVINKDVSATLIREIKLIF